MRRVARMECAETPTSQRVGVRQIEAMGVDGKSGKVKRNGTESAKASNALDVYIAFAKKT